MINSDPNYCSLVLVNRGVTVSEDGSSVEVDVQLYGPVTHVCWMEERQLTVSVYTSNTFWAPIIITLR